MTDATRRRWPRATLLGAAAMIAAIHPGCSCSDDTTPGGSTTTTTTTTTTSGGGMGGAGGMGAGGMGGAGGGTAALDIQEVAPARAFDVTPGPEGNNLYYTGVSAFGTVGVFKASVATGDQAQLVGGDPFIAPFGIATSLDGAQLYVTDPGAVDANGLDAGQILRINITNATVTTISGGEGTVPRSIEAYEASPGNERLIFTGVDPADRQVGVFDLPAAGGTPTPLYKGAPLVDPSGVAISPDGLVYVCDTRAGIGESAAVIVIEQGIANALVTGLSVGYPCGLALSRDGASLLVSSRGASTGKDAILRIDLASGGASALTSLIDAHNEPAGLHRAKNADVFGFADSQADGTGLLFVIKD